MGKLKNFVCNNIWLIILSFFQINGAFILFNHLEPLIHKEVMKGYFLMTVSLIFNFFYIYLLGFEKGELNARNK